MPHVGQHCQDSTFCTLATACWRRFQKLQALTLASNGLTGALPDTYGKAGAFPSLKSLTLSGNKISGEPHRHSC